MSAQIKDVRIHSDLRLRVATKAFDKELAALDRNGDRTIDIRDFLNENQSDTTQARENLYQAIGTALEKSHVLQPGLGHKMIGFFKAFEQSRQDMDTSTICPAPEQDVLYQASTLGNLASDLVGDVRLESLGFNKGAKTLVGVGTLQKGHGEIIIDKEVYHVDAKTMRAKELKDLAQKVPFMVTTAFQADSEPVMLTPSEKVSWTGLQTQLSNLMKAQQVPHVFRISGTFDITTRSIHPQHEPDARLSTAVDKQVEVTTRQQAGTMIVFWLPEIYGDKNLGQINAAGFHAHFVPQDKTQIGGGHVLDASLVAGHKATVEMDTTCQLEIAL